MMTTTNITVNRYRKPVMCIDTGEIFASATETAKHFGTSIDNISNVCRGVTKTSMGMHFCYINEEKTPIVKSEIVIQKSSTVKGKGRRSGLNCNAVLCIDTGEVFTSGLDAAEHFGTCNGSISRVCNGKSKHARGHRFCYIKDLNCHLNEITEAISKAKAYDLIVEKENKKNELIAGVSRREEEVLALETKLYEAQQALEQARTDLEEFNTSH